MGIATVGQLIELLHDLDLAEPDVLEQLEQQHAALRSEPGVCAEVMKQLVLHHNCLSQSESEHLLRVRPPELIQVLRAFELVRPGLLSEQVLAERRITTLVALARYLKEEGGMSAAQVRRLFLADTERVFQTVESCGLLEREQLFEMKRWCRQKGATLVRLGKELLQRELLSNYQVQQLLIGSHKDLVLGPYVLLGRLGQGGMGVVYRARQRLLGRVDALKIIRPDLLTAHPNLVARFRLECKAAAQLEHPNLVRVHGADETDGTLFMAMECLAGLTLEDLVQRHGRLPWNRAVQCIFQAATALACTHQKGLVLRDIKPSNLFFCVAGALQPTGLDEMFEQAWLVKILDLGLVLQANAPVAYAALPVTGPRHTAAGVRVGTPLFMAPEQADHPHAVDVRSDIYSLGTVFYYLLTGAAPFSGRTLQELIDAHRHLQPAPIPDLPAEPARVLARMLAKLPQDRYADPAELIRDLEACCQPGLVDTSTPPENTELCRRIRLPLAGQWYSRSRYRAEVGWKEAGLSPGEIKLHPAKEYHWKASRQPGAVDLPLGLTHLQPLQNLKALDLDECKREVTDSVLAMVGDFPALTHLSLQQCAGVGDSGVGQLVKLQALQSLRITGCWRVRDTALAELLGKLPGLEELDLSETNATGKVLRVIGSLARLRVLSLRGCRQLGNDDLRFLTGLKDLRHLNLADCDTFTDEAVAHLCRLQGLNELILSNCRLTGTGMDRIRSHLPRCRINCKVMDRCS